MTGTASTIEALYEATLDASLWTKALGQIVDAVGGCAGVLQFVDHDAPAFEIRSSVGYDVTKVIGNAGYREALKYDVWAARALPRERDGATLVGTKYVPAAEYRNSIVHNEFNRPLGDDWDWRDFIGIAPRLAGRMRAALFIYRSGRQDDFGLAELDLMNQLRPHILTAMKIDQRFGELNALVCAMEDALDERAEALLFLDRSGRVVRCNTRAQQMFAGPRSILRLQAGVLHIREPQQDRKFRRLLASSLSNAATIDVAPPSSTLLVWNDFATGQKYSLCLTPNLGKIAFDPVRSASTAPAVVVSISDFHARTQRISVRMRQAYSLTTAEAAVVSRVVAGAKLVTICAETGVAMSTVRTQLKSIFQKTGATSQTDLVRIALTGF